ncbi:glucose-6-phosphate dehydrogenase [Myxacorys almedinensis]|uniref:Glucose-6-phosphate dehydrogenase n=1 Tax=Myxacorys almedinensis A TaxID=2690445 RepID=A0A8J7Z0E6_9CYAN|nr:glucose-6-phosphate dehydrogenase [Myxacorys almedinensis]NDJ16780.1 glucose-6-phosphate dehydrogenase [Myxacorys almedinensis A]
MVAFAPSDVPSSVNSVEKLIVWANSLMDELHPSVTAIEASGVAERVCASGLFKITATDPVTWRAISRTSIPIGSSWRRGNAKIWTFAQDISSQAIPTEYKS